MDIQRGFRGKLDQYLNTGEDIQINMDIKGKAVYDFCCFGLDAHEKLSDDRYMIFYNQLTSPNNEIRLNLGANRASFHINLEQLPNSIRKIMFAVSIDQDGTMGEIYSHTVSIGQNGRSALEMELTGSSFTKEKAIISIELYRKDVWRVAAVASGFFGGLGDLLRACGGEESEGSSSASPAVGSPQNITSAVISPAPAPPPASTSSPADTAATSTAAEPPKRRVISLEKKIAQNAPQLISLAKTLTVSLKKNNLEECKAKVALVLDMSGSMQYRYKSGAVQEVVNRVVPIAVQFDDDGQFDCWFFGDLYKKVPVVTLKNYKQTVPEDWPSLMKKLGYMNNEPAVMIDVVKHFKNSREPVYVIFVSDGGITSTEEIQSILIKTSKLPIFWQFVGIGGSRYGVLEKLDTMSGRFVDNANFFALDDLKQISDAELYDRLLKEFPVWLKEIKRLNIIRE
ncbi:MAG: VWA domain-containing protein [Candidatus Bruticola sp.]